MRHGKKKKRSKASKQAGAGKAVVCNGDKEEQSVLHGLTEAFDSVYLTESAASVYMEGNGEPNKAAEILGGLAGSSENQITSCSGSSGGSVSSSLEANCGQNGFREKSKLKKVVVATGTVSTVLGKDYVRRNSSKNKGFSDGTLSKEDAEQFLCSMLGDKCELSMAVVRDVLCQCRSDVEKALNVLLELSSSCELSKNGLCCDYNPSIKGDTQFSLESSDSLTDKASDSMSHSSESELQDSIWPTRNHCGNYSKILAGSEAHNSASPTSSESELPQKVLESLFKTPKSFQHEPKTMNWRNIVKKMESLGPRVEFYSSYDAELQQHNDAGDEYEVFRKASKQHWDSMKSNYQKAATAYANGQQEYAAYLSEQGRIQSTMARQADEKASQDLFKARNQSIENVITIDLHGQHVKQAMRLLKLHLLFGAYVRSVRLFRVITGCGSHGVGKSKLKHSVINLVEKEGVEWTEENRGTLLIKLNGQTEFSFLDSESDGE